MLLRLHLNGRYDDSLQQLLKDTLNMLVTCYSSRVLAAAGVDTPLRRLLRITH